MAISKFNGKRALITGGLGFIGSNLAYRLLEMGAEVALVDSLIPTLGGNLHNVNGLEGHLTIDVNDIRNEKRLHDLVQNRDFLFNLAGHTSHMDSMIDPEMDLELNTSAQITVLEACRKHNRAAKIIFTSTRQVYGKPEYLPVDEKHPVNPVDANGINKLAGEQYHLLYHRAYGLRTCVLRLTNTYGPRMRIKDARQNFFGVWVRSIMEGRPFEVWGGDQLRDFNYIGDCVDGILLAAENDDADGHVFNLGDEVPVSLLELANILVEINGGGEFSIRPYPEDRQKIEIGDYYSDISRFGSLTGWKPQVSIRDGIKRTLDYFRKYLRFYL